MEGRALSRRNIIDLVPTRNGEVVWVPQEKAFNQEHRKRTPNIFEGQVLGIIAGIIFTACIAFFNSMLGVAIGIILVVAYIGYVIKQYDLSR